MFYFNFSFIACLGRGRVSRVTSFYSVFISVRIDECGVISKLPDSTARVFRPHKKRLDSIYKSVYLNWRMTENNVYEQEEFLCFSFFLLPKDINICIHSFIQLPCALCLCKDKIQQDKLLIFAGIVHNKITAWPRHTNDHNIVITTHNWTSKSVSHCSDW